MAPQRIIANAINLTLTHRHETTNTHTATCTPTPTHTLCVRHTLTFKGRIDIAYIVAADGGANQPVRVRCERRVELGVIVGHLVDGLYLIEVEGKLAGYTTVHARLQIRGPVLADHVFAAAIVLADACHARIDRLAAIDVLDGVLAEKEIHKVADVEGADKVGFWQEREKIIIK